jgi:RNAse (barnase) inhibitor barstar
MSQSAWTKSAAPWFHLLSATPNVTCDWLWALERDTNHKLVARLIRGRKSATAASFFDEMAAALQFPHYFGENWDALHDCLADFSWLRGDALVLCIAHADRLFAKAPTELKKLAEVLLSAAKEWNDPEKSKKPRAFHVVLQVEPGHEAVVKTAWHAAGVELAPVAARDKT